MEGGVLWAYLSLWLRDFHILWNTSPGEKVEKVWEKVGGKKKRLYEERKDWEKSVVE